jgi:SAM-dependent methyltransferase
MNLQVDDPECPFCKTSAASDWGVVSGHLIYECSECGVVFFRRPIAKSADYDDYYPYLRHFDRDRFEWELSIRRPKYRTQLRVIRRLHRNAKTLLDIGAGPGYLCRVAREEGWEAAGVETSQPAIAAGTKQFGVRYVTLDRVATASQDAITCHHVIEHIEDGEHFLRTLRAKLRDEGVLVVQVPHREPLSFLARNNVDRVFGAKRDRRCQLYYPEHISGFTGQSLVKAVSRFGFAPLRVRTASMWSPYHEPFFLRNYFCGVDGRRLPWTNLLRLALHTTRCLADSVGTIFGNGDWVVAHFRAVP